MAAIYSRRFSVMRLAYREPVAVASRRSFLAGSPRSWRLTGDVVPPALPPSFLVPSGSGGSSVSVDQWFLNFFALRPPSALSFCLVPPPPPLCIMYGSNALILEKFIKLYKIYSMCILFYCPCFFFLHYTLTKKQFYK